MKPNALLCLFIGLITALNLQAQNNISQPSELIAGPMLGYAEHREVLIWLEVSPQVNKVMLRYWKQNEPNAAQNIAYQGTLQQTFNPIKIAIGGLEPNTTYNYEVILNDLVQKMPYPLTFKTKDLWEWRKAAPDFTFHIGSCLYVNDPPYDRPGKPYGTGFDVIEQMTQQNADFMLWLGDNTYLREVDWASEYGIKYRYQHTRRQTALQALWATRPHYAIWDDHDFGPNDSNLSYNGKAITLQAFKDYWGNWNYGQPDDKGIYGYFSWSDADFFLLDNRYHRSSHHLSDTDLDKAYLGKAQMQWLKNALLVSKANFKFIASGSQVINQANDFECMRQYQREFEELINFIAEHKISGVIFLSGDRHFSEILQYKPQNAYTLYDITASPLSSGAFAKIADNEKEGKNPQRVKNALCNTQNYISIAIQGEKDKRKAIVKCYNGKGKEVFSHEIKAKDLGWDTEK
jgi:alkaline phosphatase D